jgi:hypothetical protein
MSLSQLSEAFFQGILPILLTWLTAELIRLARKKAQEVQDGILRERLLELVRAAEQMIPGPSAGQARFNHVRALAPLGTTREQIEAAVQVLNAQQRKRGE